MDMKTFFQLDLNAKILFYAIYVFLSNFNCAKTTSLKNIKQEELQDVVTQLWFADKNRVKLALNFQSHVTGNERRDLSPSRFFENGTYDHSIKKPTVRQLLQIYALYDDIIAGKSSFDQIQLKQLTDKFLDEIMKTEEINILRSFLSKKGEKSADTPEKFREFLDQLWFTRYARKKSGKMGSSAFQHIFVGEIDRKNELVSGFHNWLRFATLEKGGGVDYAGFIQKGDYVTAIRYRWKGNWKMVGSMFVGTSPEFELSIYTLCLLTRRGVGRQRCSFFIGDCTLVNITAMRMGGGGNKKSGRNSGGASGNIATVYPDKFKKFDECPLKKSWDSRTNKLRPQAQGGNGKSNFFHVFLLPQVTTLTCLTIFYRL